MTPAFLVCYLRDKRLSDAKLIRYLILTLFAFFEEFNDPFSLLTAEFGEMMRFSNPVGDIPALPHIFIILGLTSEIQMRRIDALLIIAVMKDVLLLRFFLK